jgi:PIN domain nuclease of toxin-antitoxin system
MDFEDCDYSVQQVPPRSRQEKVLNQDRDKIERSRLASRVEKYYRYTPPDQILGPVDGTSFKIDDVDRFNRDYTQDQRASKRTAHELLLARANARHSQQMQYQQWVEDRLKMEEADLAKLQAHVSQHDFLQESVLYDPVTCVIPNEGTQKGTAQRIIDTKRETFREARALRIQHSLHSTNYDPITGEKRSFW